MIKFDKVYVISYVHNIDKRKTISDKLQNLDITNFEFIYGYDFHNLGNFNDIRYKGTDKPNTSYYIHGVSCGLAHLTAVQLGYDSGANSILIIEDDVLFYKDKNFIIDCLSNYPEDADLIQFGYIDWNKQTFNNVFNKSFYRSGTQMYALCNRNIMKRYIESQYNIFCSADNIDIFKYENNYDIKSNIYIVYPQLAIDPLHNKHILTSEIYEQYE